MRPPHVPLKGKDLDTATVPNLGHGPKRLKVPQPPQHAVRAGIVHGVRIGQRVLWRVNHDFFYGTVAAFQLCPQPSWFVDFDDGDKFLWSPSMLAKWLIFEPAQLSDLRYTQ